jgi:hypothetical protein
MNLDGKAHGTIVQNKDGREVPPDEWIALRPQDNAFLPTLEFYYQECARIGAERVQLEAIEFLIVRVVQLEAIEFLIVRVVQWRDEHPERCKVADVEPGEIVAG